jgi:DNA-binding PadR family transcriptional regulator
MHDLNGFQRDLLYVTVGLDEPNGLDIRNELEGYYEEHINHGRVYPNLDALAEKGLLRKGSKNDRSNYYVVTERGRRELQARRAWENAQDERLTESAEPIADTA